VADIWYYADGGGPKGPFPFEELINFLSKASDLRRILVWRQGFEDWRTVEQVREISAELFRPPPLPIRPPPLPTSLAPPPITREPSVSSDEAAQFKDVRPALSGIAGWLVLIAIGQILGPLGLAAVGMEYYGKIDKGSFENFPVSMWGEVAINAGLFWLAVYTSVLFFRHSRKFTRYFIWEMIGASTVLFVDAAWVGLSFAAYTGRSPEEFVTLSPKEVGQSISTAIVSAIWIAYILRSKRVANTFIK